MHQIELFKQSFTLYDSAHQSHLRYSINVPPNVEALTLDFQYGPIFEKNPSSIERSLIKEGLPVEPHASETAIRNLLTLSVDDPHGFRGAHHLFDKHQTIHLCQETASLGFIRDEIPAGTWEITISCHGIFSSEVTGQLTVTADSQHAANYKRPKPLSQITKKPIGKIRPLAADALALTFKKIELHAHTTHSDASQTLEELVEDAASIGLDWLAITDHNTVTAHFDWLENNRHSTRSPQILGGIEYTTFYGHFLVHGALHHLLENWTTVNLGNVADYLAQLKREPVNITIAHPFDEGNPYCTGCRWDFNLETLRHVDSLEVWNGTNPHLSIANEQAFQKWTHLLEEGYELNASYGRDWHRPTNEAFAFTYALLPEAETEEEVLAALTLGRTYVSLRPVIQSFTVNQQYQLGDRIEGAASQQLISWHINLKLGKLEVGDSLRFYSERGLIEQLEWNGITVTELIHLEGDTRKSEHALLTVELDDQSFRLLRLEIWNAAHERVAFTNSIYRHLSN